MPKVPMLLFSALLGNVCCAQQKPGADTSLNAKVKMVAGIATSTPAAKVSMTLYPNPAKNKVTLRVNQFHPGMAVVRIVDTRGKLVKEETRLLVSGDEEIVVFLMLNPGIYFISVNEQSKVARKKLVVL